MIELQANFTRIGELHLTPGRVTSRGREEKLSEESRNSSRNPVWSNEKLKHPLTSYPISQRLAKILQLQSSPPIIPWRGHLLRGHPERR